MSEAKKYIGEKYTSFQSMIDGINKEEEDWYTLHSWRVENRGGHSYFYALYTLKLETSRHDYNTTRVYMHDE